MQNEDSEGQEIAVWQLMEIGGWSDDRTMRKIYTHIAERSRKNFGREFTRFFDVPEGKENENCNENCNEKLKA